MGSPEELSVRGHKQPLGSCLDPDTLLLWRFPKEEAGAVLQPCPRETGRMQQGVRIKAAAQGLLMASDTQFLRTSHCPGPSGASGPLVASWHPLPHKYPSCLPTVLSHQGLLSPSSLHGLPAPRLLRVSPCLANLPGSSAAAPLELQRRPGKRHQGALNNPASSSWAE